MAWTTEREKLQIVDLFQNQLLLQREIIEVTGLSKATVSRILRQYNLGRNTQQEKICRSCGGRFDVSEFCPTISKCGNRRLRSKCKECYKEEKRLCNTNQRQKYIGALRLPRALYDRVYKEQGGCCLICHQHADVLCVDHDHFTKKFRGLLCRQCNAAFGLMNEDVDRLQRMIEYKLNYS